MQVRTVPGMRIVGLVAAAWVVVAFGVVVFWAGAGRMLRRRRPATLLPDDVVESLDRVYADERARERSRALGYLRGLRNRQVRLVDVGLAGSADRGDQLVFGDGTTVHLLPRGVGSLPELFAAVSAGAVVALAAVDLLPGRVTFTFRCGGRPLTVGASDLAVL